MGEHNEATRSKPNVTNSRLNRRRMLQGSVALGAGAAAWSAPNIKTMGFAPAYAATVSAGCETTTGLYYAIGGSFNCSIFGCEPNTTDTGVNQGTLTVTPSGCTVTVTYTRSGPPFNRTHTISASTFDAGCTLIADGASIPSGGSATVTPNGAFNEIPITFSCGPACP